MNVINSRTMLIENCLSILFVLFALPSSIFISYIKTVIVLFKVVLLIIMSTNTDLVGVSLIIVKNTNFTLFCYFVDKLILAVFTKLCLAVYRKTMFAASDIILSKLQNT